jgi:tight adherence protein B
MPLMLIALLAVVAIAGLGFVFVGAGDGQAKTLKRVQTIAATGKVEKVRRSTTEVAANRRRQIVQNLRTVDRAQRKQSLSLDARLSQTGLSISIQTFWIISAVLGVALMLAAIVFSHNLLIALALGAGAAIGAPRWTIGMLAARRRQKFTAEFPNATDIIVRGVKSGLPINECLKVIARESPQPLGEEFGRLVENMAIGLSTEQALEKLYTRMPTAEVRFFSIVLAIQQKTGGNLAEALGNLSSVLRARKLMVEKIKALSGEAVASAFIIGAMPPGVMILIQLMTPSYMAPMFHDPRGHTMLFGSVIWMGTGIFVMRRMINFKF